MAPLRSFDLPFRQTTKSSGIWLIALIPLLLIRSLQFQSALHLTLASTLALTVSPTFDVLSLATLIGHSWMILAFGMAPELFQRSDLLTYLFVGTFWHNLLASFPGSFTVGESILLTHLVWTFAHHSPPLLAFLIIAVALERTLKSCSSQSKTSPFLQSLLFLLVLLNTTLLFLSYRSPLISLLWPKVSCLLSFQNLVLLLVWLLLFLLCITMVMLVPTEPVDDSSVITEVDGSGDGRVEDVADSKSPRKSPFWLRKAFHAAAGLVFASGIVFAPQLLSLAALGLLTLFYLLEVLRRYGPDQISQRLNQLLNPFRDSRDSGTLLFTPITLLLGLSLPIWWPCPSRWSSTSSVVNGEIEAAIELVDLKYLCFNLNKSQPHYWIGVLSIAIGDSLAALIGRRWGVRKWPYSHRTLLGSSVSWLAQALIWWPIATNYNQPWFKGLVWISASCLAEAYLEQIDNLVVPLITMLTLPPFKSRHGFC